MLEPAVARSVPALLEVEDVVVLVVPGPQAVKLIAADTIAAERKIFLMLVQ